MVMMASPLDSFNLFLPIAVMLILQALSSGSQITPNKQESVSYSSLVLQIFIKEYPLLCGLTAAVILFVCAPYLKAALATRRLKSAKADLHNLLSTLRDAKKALRVRAVMNRRRLNSLITTEMATNPEVFQSYLEASKQRLGEHKRIIRELDWYLHNTFFTIEYLETADLPDAIASLRTDLKSNSDRNAQLGLLLADHEDWHEQVMVQLAKQDIWN